MSNIIFWGVLWGGGGGRYIKSMGNGGTKMSANVGLIIVKTYIQAKTIENQIFIYGPKCKFFAYLRGPGGALE